MRPMRFRVQQVRTQAEQQQQPQQQCSMAVGARTFGDICDAGTWALLGQNDRPWAVAIICSHCAHLVRTPCCAVLCCVASTVPRAPPPNQHATLQMPAQPEQSFTSKSRLRLP